MNNLLALFISESRDLLQQAGESLLALEKNPEDSEVIPALFRFVHTLKGNSGLFEFPEMTLVLHKSEDLMVLIREGKLPFTREVADVLLDAMDFVGSLLDEIETNEELIHSHEKTMQEHIENIQAFIPEKESGRNTTASAGAAGSSAISANTPDILPLPFSPPSFLANIPEKEKQTLFIDAIKQKKPLHLVIYTPEEECFFKGEDPFYQILRVPDNLGGTMVPRVPFPSLNSFDCYQCILNFYCISNADKEKLSDYFKYVSEQVRIEPISPYALIVPQGEPNGGPVYGDFVIEGLAYLEKGDLDSLRFSCQTLLDFSSPSLWICSALRWLLILLENIPREKEIIKKLLEAVNRFEPPRFPLLEEKQEVQAADKKQESIIKDHNGDKKEIPESHGSGTNTNEPDSITSVIKDLLENQREILSSTMDTSWEEGRTQACITTIRRCLESLDLKDMEGFESAAEDTIAARDNRKLLVWLENFQGPFVTPPPEGPLPPKPAKKNTEKADLLPSLPGPERHRENTIQFLKVDQFKIDRLMDLIGEIVVAKNALPYLAGKAETVYEVRELSNEIKNQYSIINRIAENLQNSIMQIRMVPLSVAFQRFPRLIRDLSRKLDKAIELKMEGEEIEVDKAIVEALGEPLIHLVRNSIGHGIEMPEIRVEQGKPPTGIITLRAFQESNNVVVEIADDGKGLDPDKIKQKACEQELITKDQMETMNDQDAINLIFLSGFSTAESTSEISGRGVGMDAVKNMVEKIGGQVKVKSSPRQGTCINLHLPVSMAITNIMTIETNKQLFGVPMDILEETVRVPGKSFQKIKNYTTMVLRDRVIPVFFLNELLNIEKDNLPNEDDEYAVCVVQVNGETVGIIADGFRDVVDIILRPLEGSLSLIPGYSGTAILGDGTVLLVLNVKELF